MYALPMATALGEYRVTRQALSADSANGHRKRISPSVLIARWLATHLPGLATVRTVLLNVLAGLLVIYGVFLLVGVAWACLAAAAVLLVGDWWISAQADSP
jgi:hypothetical protein